VKRLVVLISGTGRNLQAIIEAVRDGTVRAEIAAVISNNPAAPGLEHARAAGIPAVVVDHRQFPDRESFETELRRQIDRCSPDFVVLAGFMRILGSAFVQQYSGRLLNIHPSLLPKYPGLQTHAKALADGEKWHGASVHFVTEDVDGGPVVLQGRIAVQAGDTSETLAERVMQAVELRIYPLVLSWAVAGRLELRDGQAFVDGRRLELPLQFDALKERDTAQRMRSMQ
jgi:phosphoribosylglycinamide formyltransferase-1